MLSRSTWLHLRIPFSYYLLPVWLFAFALSNDINIIHTVLSFLIIHFLLYPASNAYNSYFDKDEKSIGGLEHPPAVTMELYRVALALDFLAIVLSWIAVNFTFAVMIFIYGIVSKLYSHPAVRLKKYAITGWLITGLFQGFFTFLMCYAGMNNDYSLTAGNEVVLLGGGLTSVMLLGNYPMTQVYQHEEDTRHNDRTISLMLGIKGTFIFVQIVFSIAAVCFALYFKTFFGIQFSVAFLAALTPVVVYFMIWFLKVWKDETQADFKHTMRLNLISATCLNVYFLYFALRG